MKLPVDRLAALGLLVFVAACGHTGESRPLTALAAGGTVPATGPAADYPMVLGEPFAIDGVTYTPADTMNYDRVGYAVSGPDGGTAVTLADRTLPLPSYAEVTALKTGRTILARVERRGPMTGDNLVELSPGAAAQLGMTDGRAPVRVRRVNPSEPERALLRSGQQAPERMDTPMSLAAVLLRKLEPDAAAPVPPAQEQAIAPAAMPSLAEPKAATAPAPQVSEPKPVLATSKPAPKSPTPRANPAAPGNRVVVQVATFSNAASAADVAKKLGGVATPAGKYHRVRIVGFASKAEAGAALAKARRAGYSDARIQRAD
ncbi:MAG: SPOR domain-containing protein [Alphaproteobacteria bacterium]|nr:SPOR domain-containing protein [Alphaproteobacteria bacterium]